MSEAIGPDQPPFSADQSSDEARRRRPHEFVAIAPPDRGLDARQSHLSSARGPAIPVAPSPGPAARPRSAKAGLWPTIISRSSVRSRSHRMIVAASVPARRMSAVSSMSSASKLLGDDLGGRAGRVAAGSSRSGRASDPSRRRPASDLPHPFLALGRQWPIIVGDARRPVFDGDPMSHDVKLVHHDPRS